MLLWERFPQLYRWYRTNPLSGLFLRTESAGLQKLLAADATRAPARILDIGTGTGFSLRLLGHQDRVVAIDICLPLLRGAGRLYPDTAYLQADARHLPFRDGSFGLISMVGVTDYITDKDTLLHKFHNLLAPGGRLLITFAPRSPLNAFRRLLGHRLHLLTVHDIRSLVNRSPFHMAGQHRTALQMQYLLQKKLL